MIAKTSLGKGAGGAVEYNLFASEKNALSRRSPERVLRGTILDSNGVAITLEEPRRIPGQVERAFREDALLNSRCEKLVWHQSFSFDPSEQEQATDALMRQIARGFLREFGMEGHRYVVIRHDDKPHPHFHVVASRIHPETGRVATDRYNYVRNERFSRRMEQEHGLLHYCHRQRQRVREGAAVAPPAERSVERPQEPRSDKASLVAWLRAELPGQLHRARSLTDLQKNLRAEGIRVEIGRGIRFRLGESALVVKGSEVGRAYALAGIQAQLAPASAGPRLAGRFHAGRRHTGKGEEGVGSRSVNRAEINTDHAPLGERLTRRPAAHREALKARFGGPSSKAVEELLLELESNLRSGGTALGLDQGERSFTWFCDQLSQCRGRSLEPSRSDVGRIVVDLLNPDQRPSRFSSHQRRLEAVPLRQRTTFELAWDVYRDSLARYGQALTWEGADVSAAALNSLLAEMGERSARQQPINDPRNAFLLKTYLDDAVGRLLGPDGGPREGALGQVRPIPRPTLGDLASLAEATQLLERVWDSLGRVDPAVGEAGSWQQWKEELGAQGVRLYVPTGQPTDAEGRVVRVLLGFSHGDRAYYLVGGDLSPLLEGPQIPTLFGEPVARLRVRHQQAEGTASSTQRARLPAKASETGKSGPSPAVAPGSLPNLLPGSKPDETENDLAQIERNLRTIRPRH